MATEPLGTGKKVQAGVGEVLSPMTVRVTEGLVTGLIGNGVQLYISLTSCSYYDDGSQGIFKVEAFRRILIPEGRISSVGLESSLCSPLLPVMSQHTLTSTFYVRLSL